jgi:hypothetical protein
MLHQRVLIQNNMELKNGKFMSKTFGSNSQPRWKKHTIKYVSKLTEVRFDEFGKENNMTCEKCEKESNKLYPMVYGNGDKLMICQECVNWAELQADMEYERYKEEVGNV